MLGSGSAGNATLISAGNTHVLVDCGFTAVEAERRLQRLGLAASDLTAILVTHEHGDHLNGVGPLARRHQLPVYLSAGTHSAWRQPAPKVTLIDPQRPFQIGGLEIAPYPVPHDARQPCQFVFRVGDLRLGMLSDVGHITPHIRRMLDGVDGLLLECNHDRDLLEEGPYPYRLKQRVGGDSGHLSNEQAAELLDQLDCQRLQHLALIHLSETNNEPHRALHAVRALHAAPRQGVPPVKIHCATQATGLDWQVLRPISVRGLSRALAQSEKPQQGGLQFNSGQFNSGADRSCAASQIHITADVVSASRQVGKSMRCTQFKLDCLNL